MPAPKVGQVIHNKYRLLRHIGDGGMGSVYEARHETLGTTVALKFLHLEFARREGLVQRFLQEARASARIQSPHVVRVWDVDQSPEGDVFIVLEYLEGQTLQALYEDLYRSGRKLPYADALDYAEQMLDGVEAAHAAGIVHRDLKPDNVMVTLDAKGVTVLKLLDFGIAKLKVIGGAAPESARGLTRPGVMMGTPEYMAPEQATSADMVDARADVFALGVIIFEMLAGQRPVGGDNPLELAAAYRAGRVSRLADLVPGIAPELAAAVHRALSPDAKSRFATAAELREAIAPFSSAVRAPSPSRLRAGGTIGIQAESSGVLASPLAPGEAPKAPPPPTAEARPLGERLAKTWPPSSMGTPEGAPQTPQAAMGPGSGRITAPASVGTGGGGARGVPPATVVDDGVGEAAGPDRTHRIGEPYAPPASPPAAPSPSGGPPPIAIVNAPASRAFADVPGPGTVRGRVATGRRPRPNKGLPLVGVLVAAACVACAVVGVTYLATRASSTDTRDDDPAPLAPVSTAGARGGRPAEPSPPSQPGAADEPPNAPPAVPQAPPQGRPRGRGRPRSGPPAPAAPAAPSTDPNQPSTPAPSGDPNAPPATPPPSQPPALVLPSALPFPNPFDPGE